MSSALLEIKNSFFILSMYAVGLSALVGLNVAKTYFDLKAPEYGEFFLKSNQGKDLPMGTFLRFKH
jgi:23S rRNA (cytosine1962-C5)-methyltransferase